LDIGRPNVGGFTHNSMIPKNQTTKKKSWRVKVKGKEEMLELVA
jgi:hypothetical protein